MENAESMPFWNASTGSPAGAPAVPLDMVDEDDGEETGTVLPLPSSAASSFGLGAVTTAPISASLDGISPVLAYCATSLTVAILSIHVEMVSYICPSVRAY